MTKEEFTRKLLMDQYERKLEKKRKFICNDADIHMIKKVEQRK